MGMFEITTGVFQQNWSSSACYKDKMPHSATNRVGFCVSKQLSVFFEVLPYHTVRVFLFSPAPTHYRHVHQINDFRFSFVKAISFRGLWTCSVLKTLELEPMHGYRIAPPRVRVSVCLRGPLTLPTLSKTLGHNS
jgi:hypothetical protein